MPRQTSHSSHVRVIDTRRNGEIRIGRPIAHPVDRQSSSIAAEELVTWVTGSGDPGAQNIAKILELLVELGNVHHREGAAETFVWRGREFKAAVEIPKSGGLPRRSQREHELISKLNPLLRRYTFSPWYWTALGDFHLMQWWSRNERPSDPEDPESGIDFDEEDAILRIMDLAREGILSRVRRCSCGDWFFAKFSHQKFCCTRCQQDYYRSSEEYRAKRRLYMKNLREIHKKTCPVSRPAKTSKRSEGKKGTK